MEYETKQHIWKNSLLYSKKVDWLAGFFDESNSNEEPLPEEDEEEDDDHFHNTQDNHCAVIKEDRTH